MNKNSTPAILLIISAVLFAVNKSADNSPDGVVSYPFPGIAAVFAGRGSEADALAGLTAGIADMIEADAAPGTPKLLFVASVSRLWAAGAKDLAGGGLLSDKHPGFDAAVDGPFREVFPNEVAAEPLNTERRAQAAELFRSLSSEVDKAR